MKGALVCFGVLLGFCIFYTLKAISSLCSKGKPSIAEEAQQKEDGEWEDASGSEESEVEQIESPATFQNSQLL